MEGVLRLYGAGARAFVEVGPKRALKCFVDDVLSDKTDVMSLFTNRPRPKEVASFKQALAGLYAGGKRYREAMDELLEIVRRARDWKEGEARRQLLSLFTIAGDEPELVAESRRKLASALY